MSKVEAYDAVLSQLDQWRHFPDYQLERRTDIYFAIYLRSFLQLHAATVLQSTVIPEFPIKRDLIWQDPPTHKSVKVDYVLFSEDKSKVFFVELKTDNASRRPAQDDYLATARRIGFRAILEGLLKIITHTTSHQKYYHLLSALSNAGFISLPRELGAALFAASPTPHTHLYERIKLVPLTPSIQVLYLQPVIEEGLEDHVDFETFATFLEARDDGFASSFASYLRRWTTPAGTIPPAPLRTGQLPAA